MSSLVKEKNSKNEEEMQTRTLTTKLYNLHAFHYCIETGFSLSFCVLITQPI